MTVDDLSVLFADCDVAGPASDMAIAAAENALGVRFPVSYRGFLSTYGAVLCGGLEIAGLFEGEYQDEPPLWSDVVTTTNGLRRASRGGIPASYIAISDDGGEYKFYIDVSQESSTGECPVVVLGPGAEGVVVADDFLDFVIRSLNEEISF